MSDAPRGVVGMVTNNAYLDNPTSRGMRYHLMQNFDPIYSLAIHGIGRKGEFVSEEIQKALGIDEVDQNVFDIMQGVSGAFL